jgi:hypothetical protein
VEEWNSSSNVTILNFSQRHINVEIKSSGNGLVWKLTGFYGHPDPDKGLGGLVFAEIFGTGYSLSVACGRGLK